MNVHHDPVPEREPNPGSYVVYSKQSSDGKRRLAVKHSHWEVGYTAAHKETALEAVQAAEIQTVAEIHVLKDKLTELMALSAEVQREEL